LIKPNDPIVLPCLGLATPNKTLTRHSCVLWPNQAHTDFFPMTKQGHYCPVIRDKGLLGSTVSR